MFVYDPIFGICFYPRIIGAVERIKEKENKTGYTGDLIGLNSDAEHQSDKSEHPV